MTTEAELFETLTLHIVVDKFGSRRHYNRAKQLHRDAGPAVEYANGTGLWFHNGVLHRTDGPAVVYDNGTCEWWIKGIPLSQQSYLSAVEHYDH